MRSRFRPMLRCIGLVFFLTANVSSAKGAEAWIADPDTGCEAWFPYVKDEDTASWAGECLDGKAIGPGILLLFRDGEEYSTFEGELKEGKAHGRGATSYSSGIRYEGEWLEGYLHGKGAHYFSSGRAVDLRGSFETERSRAKALGTVNMVGRRVCTGTTKDTDST